MMDAPPFLSAAKTHPGNIRPMNEDSHLARDAAGIWAVADGMGGHDAGDMASRMLADALQTVAAPASAAELLAECEARVVEVNERLLAIAAERNTVIGTTLAMLLGYEGHFACVWSGDSRIYLLRNEQIVMLSHDHTEVQELVDRGILTAEEGRASARRNVITRAIGVTPRAELESVQGVFEPGDVFVLCSDGLTTYVSDDELLKQAGSLAAPDACEALIALALARGGSDNVTVIIVHYKGGQALPGQVERTRDTVIDLSNAGGTGASAERDWS